MELVTAPAQSKAIANPGKVQSDEAPANELSSIRAYGYAVNKLKLPLAWALKYARDAGLNRPGFCGGRLV